MITNLTRFTRISALLLAFSAMLHAAEVTVLAPDSTMVRHALGKLEAALQQQSDTLKIVKSSESAPNAQIVVAVDPALQDALGAEGFQRERSNRAVKITAADERGAMYGVLDVAMLIRTGTPLKEIEPSKVNARFEFRAIKFNLPWSAYRTNDVLEQHKETCKDLKFWEDFLDMMTENRFNVLSLWSMHPFTYMIRPANFPEACRFNDTELAEWKKLWSGIFAMAKERGIETYLLNWNVFVSPEFSKAHDVAQWSQKLSHIGGKDDFTNDLVTRYTKEVVTQVLIEYPDLTGLGITLGERMGGKTADERRKWLDQTFIAGIADAKRPTKFIYRAPLSAGTGSGGSTSEENDRETREQIEKLPDNIKGPVYVEFKHNWSHGHSSPDLFIVHGGKLSDAYWNPPPTRHRVIWTMRNEDMYILRWGQPDFVREFIQRQDTKDYVGGVFVGSECYIPALDYISKEGPHKNWNWAFERQWLFYAVWGHLLYDFTTPDSRFEAMFDERYGKGTGKDLFAAWKLASNVPLRFASFYKGTWDASIYTEGFFSWESGRKLFNINSLIKRDVLDTKRYVNIEDYVKTGKVPFGAMSPLGLADQLDLDRTVAMKHVAKLRSGGKVAPALDYELTDIEAWCAYSDYFACKLRAGVALARARAGQDLKQQQLAIDELEKALAHWKRLADLGGKFNKLPVLHHASDTFSWDFLTPEVKKDIEIAKAPLNSAD
jgi:hypothetical protein